MGKRHEKLLAAHELERLAGSVEKIVVTVPLVVGGIAFASSMFLLSAVTAPGMVGLKKAIRVLRKDSKRKSDT